jgi:flavin-dependent dehydrogenase
VSGIADDALVVGGGPAGALAALLLVRRGWRVRLFDRARFPRPKLCGDTLNPGALAVLARHVDGPAVRALGCPIRGMRISGPGGVSVRGTYPAGVAGVAVTRAVLDAWLLGRAAAAGVVVDEGTVVAAPAVVNGRVTGVRVRTAAGERAHRARLVIAADGRRSVLAAALHLASAPRRPRRWAIGAYVQGVSGVDAAYGEMHVRQGRYLGIAPTPSGEANVCLVVPRAGARVIGGTAEGLLAAARADGAVAGRFASAQVTGVPTVLGPMAADVAVPGAPGLLLAGDAAGFIDPMTGDGLRFALAGAELAAEVADDVLSGAVTPEHAPQRLARRRRAAFAGKWRFNRAVRALVGSPGVGLAAAAARAWPALIERLVCYAGDVGSDWQEASCPSR